MKKIFAFIASFFIFGLLSASLIPFADAATVRGNDTIIISEDEENLSDLYLFGGTIDVNAPVENDLVAAGGNITLDNDVSGSIMAAGGNLRIEGASGGSVRVTGGNVVIEGNVARDLVVAGGTVRVARTSRIGGDLLIAGGELVIDGQIDGRAVINGGEVYLNGRVGRQVEGNIGNLSLGRGAVVGGDLRYTSPQRASIAEGAQVRGDHRFTRVEDPEKAAEGARAFITGFSIYKLITDIIVSLAFVYFLGRLLVPVLRTSAESPVLNGVFGLAYLILFPVISMFLLILLWLGITSFLFYGLIVIVAVFVAKIFLGWFILRWWYGRDKQAYDLDWKAAVTGPIFMFIIGLIPVLGWLVLGVIYLISTGAVVRELLAITRPQQKSVQRRK